MTRIEVSELAGGALHLRFQNGKGNILDLATVRALRGQLRASLCDHHRVLILEGVGPHFSYGASIEDHLPEQMRVFLPEFHGWFRDLVERAVPTFAVVRGQCLGGGLELAAFCQRVFAAPDSRLGCPEVRLAVFAPVGSLILPRRVGQQEADHLLTTGVTLSADRALAIGLVDSVSEDPLASALETAGTRFGPLSRSALRHALRASRWLADKEFLGALDELERYYLDTVMGTSDAVEGIQAFLEKRPPRWS